MLHMKKIQQEEHTVGSWFILSSSGFNLFKCKLRTQSWQVSFQNNSKTGCFPAGADFRGPWKRLFALTWLSAICFWNKSGVDPKFVALLEFLAGVQTQKQLCVQKNAGAAVVGTCCSSDGEAVDAMGGKITQLWKVHMVSGILSFVRKAAEIWHSCYEIFRLECALVLPDEKLRQFQLFKCFAEVLCVGSPRSNECWVIHSFVRGCC